MAKGKVDQSTGFVMGMCHGAVRESSFTRYWFLTLAILSFGIALLIPIGCMSPPTRYFALFSINPRELAQLYNSQLGNTTDTTTSYNGNPIDADFLVLPDVYRVGMSGVCRETYNSGEPMRCTRHFPQMLDLGVIIDEDLNKSNSSNSTTSHIRMFWSSFNHDDTQPIVQHKSLTTALVRASAGLTLTSVVIAPICLGIIILMFMLERPHYTTVATCFGLFDAALMMTAAALWITASVMYACDIQSALGGQAAESTSLWGGTDLFPLSIGLFLFSIAALAKVIVLPIMALICLFLLLLLFVAAAFLAWLAFLALVCIFNMFGVCGDEQTTTTTETVYYTTDTTSNWTVS